MTIDGKGKPFFAIFFKEKEELRRFHLVHTVYVEIRTNMSYWYDINFDTSSDYRVLMRLPMSVYSLMKFVVVAVVLLFFCKVSRTVP